MEFELTQITFADKNTLIARMENSPRREFGTGVNATFEVPLRFTLEDSLEVIAARAMTKLRRALDD